MYSVLKLLVSGSKNCEYMKLTSFEGVSFITTSNKNDPLKFKVNEI